MKIEKIKLWENVPGKCEEVPYLTAYIPDTLLGVTHKGAVVICPGGGYAMRANHEGMGYAEFLATHGYIAFVVDYRVAPHEFPLPLLDARRAMRYVRYNAEKYGIDKDKIAIMGSSAGGHLAAMTSTYTDKIDYEGVDEIDNEDFIPNAQILCYPVIELNTLICNVGSGKNLFGNRYESEARNYIPTNLVSEKTPKAFIWHTFEDGAVDVRNSLNYASALKEKNIPAEMHIFPEGNHGKGLSIAGDKISKHIFKWCELLLKWLEYYEF